MRHFIIISIFLFGVVSACPAFSQSAAELAAERHWNTLSDHTDPALLDELIERFPTTETARLAFMTRYFLLTQNPTIEDYNVFLSRYPQKFQSQMALQDVFNLYRDQNRAPMWLDFLRRYPNTQQGLVAKLHLQTLMAQFVMLQDDEETYDDFIETFPDAPQIPAIMELAEKRALEREQALFEKTQQEFSDDFTRVEAERRKRANEIVVEWGAWITEYNRRFQSLTTPIIENGEAFLLADRIRRYENIIVLVYRQYDAAREVRAENRHRELIEKLDSIQQTLIAHHRDLVRTIREESAETRRVLREEFARLGLRLDAGFEMLGRKMDVLHNDLVSIYQELQKVNVNLENIHTEIQRSNALLETLNVSLDETRVALVEGFTVTNENLGRLGNKVDNLTNELVDFKVHTVARLDRVIENQDRSYNLQVRQFNVQLETLEVTREIRQGQEVMIHQNDQLINLGHQQLGALNSIQQTQMQQLNVLNNISSGVQGLRGDVQGMRSDVQGLRGDVQGMRSDVQGLRGDVQGMRSDMQQGFQHLNNTMQTGFANVQRSIHEVGDQVIASNQQTIQRVTQIQQQQQQQATGGSSRSSKFKRYLGQATMIAGTVVGTTFGGPVGAAVGSTVGAGLSSVIAGGNRQDHFGALVNAGISAGVGLAGDQLQTVLPNWQTSHYPNTQIPFPPAQQIFDNVVSQGTNTLKTEITNQINNRLPPQTVPLVNSMLNVNHEQRKTLAIQSLATLAPSGVPQTTVQNILSARNEQELRNTIVNTAREHALKPEVVMFAMDHVL
jgi:uncharacterized protein YoxC